MTIREAVELVLISSQLKNIENGGIFILEMGESVLIKDLAKRMIVLSGKNENEIKIEYTGLRKGEKVSEKLFFEKEKIKKTLIPGILHTNDKLYEIDTSSYENLSSLIIKNNVGAIIKKFKEMVPEYKANDES